MQLDPSTAPTDIAKLKESLHAQRVLILAMVTLSEQSKADTESHLRRVQAYVRAMAGQLAKTPAYQDLLNPDAIDILCDSVPIYDMGNIAVPDRVLLKPGRLTPFEISIMRTHTTAAYNAIEQAERTMGRSSPMLTIAKQLVLSHQEKWDGSGYPQGLSGKQIPLSARIMAVADVFDALISNKVYKDGVAHEQAVRIILGERGAQFDPDVVDAFFQVQAEFKAIAQRYADTDADMQRKMEYMANAIAEHTEL
jgi:putative two-component system response regulator